MPGEFGEHTKAPAPREETLKTYRYICELRGNAEESLTVSLSLSCVPALQKDVDKIEFTLLLVALRTCGRFSPVRAS